MRILHYAITMLSPVRIISCGHFTPRSELQYVFQYASPKKYVKCCYLSQYTAISVMRLGSEALLRENSVQAGGLFSPPIRRLVQRKPSQRKHLTTTSHGAVRELLITIQEQAGDRGGGRGRWRDQPK